MDEEWRGIAGHANYQVSNLGRVKSLARIVQMVDGRKYTVSEKILDAKPRTIYRQVAITICAGNLWYPLVHRLVLEAFVGPCPVGMECRHGDGNPWNNRVDNLCWGTRLENAQDKQRHGTTVRGERMWTAKLTMDKARRIRELYATSGRSFDSIAIEYNVSKKTILNIVHNRIWREMANEQVLVVEV